MLGCFTPFGFWSNRNLRHQYGAKWWDGIASAELFREKYRWTDRKVNFPGNQPGNPPDDVPKAWIRDWRHLVCGLFRFWSSIIFWSLFKYTIYIVFYQSHGQVRSDGTYTSLHDVAWFCCNIIGMHGLSMCSIMFCIMCKYLHTYINIFTSKSWYITYMHVTEPDLA